MRDTGSGNLIDICFRASAQIAITGSNFERVSSRSSVKHVISGAAIERVVASFSEDQVVLITAQKAECSRCTGDTVEIDVVIGMIISNEYLSIYSRLVADCGVVGDKVQNQFIPGRIENLSHQYSQRRTLLLTYESLIGRNK